MLEEHLKICPKFVQSNLIQSLPYFNLNINILHPGEPVKQQQVEITVERIHHIYKSMSDKYSATYPELFTVYE